MSDLVTSTAWMTHLETSDSAIALTKNFAEIFTAVETITTYTALKCLAASETNLPLLAHWNGAIHVIHQCKTESRGIEKPLGMTAITGPSADSPPVMIDTVPQVFMDCAEVRVPSGETLRAAAKINDNGASFIAVKNKKETSDRDETKRYGMIPITPGMGAEVLKLYPSAQGGVKPQLVARCLLLAVEAFEASLPAVVPAVGATAAAPAKTLTSLSDCVFQWLWLQCRSDHTFAPPLSTPIFVTYFETRAAANTFLDTVNHTVQ